MLADPEPFGNFRHPVASLGNLGHRIALELVTEISLARRLLSSKLGKKASTNLGAIHSSLPNACELLGDKGYDSDWFRQALIKRGITPCILPRSNRKVQHHYDKTL